MATIVNDRDVLLQAASTRTTVLTLQGITVNDAIAALASINNISSDSILSKGEKPAVVLQYNTLIAEQSGLDGIATLFGITTEKTTYDTAITALTTYLTGLTPAYNSYTTDTTIVSTAFNSKFSDVYTAKTALFNKMSSLAAGGTLTGTSAIVTGMLHTNAATETSEYYSMLEHYIVTDPEPTWSKYADMASLTVSNTSANDAVCEVVMTIVASHPTISGATGQKFQLRADALQDGTSIGIVGYSNTIDYPNEIDLDAAFFKKVIIPAGGSTTFKCRLEGYANPAVIDTYFDGYGYAYIGAALIKK